MSTILRSVVNVASRFAIYGLLAAALSMAGGAASAAGRDQQIEALVRPLIDGKLIVGCIVGVVDDGESSLHGFGQAQHQSAGPPDGRTIFEIGSITKAFTGLLLADMVRRGEVTLDAPLNELMPEGVEPPKPKGRPITLADLASQSSGLPRMPGNFRPGNPRDPFADYTEEKLYAFLRGYTPPREPGTYEYSNLGVGLLGHLLALKAQRPYGELIAERIIGPLQLHDTCITLDSDQTARLATPHLAGGREGVPWSLNVLAPAGGLHSTADDFLKWVAMMTADATELPDPARAVHDDLQLAWQRRTGKPGEIGVGLCWHQARDGVTWFHDGLTGGYSAVVYVHPPKRLGVFVLTNTAASETSALGEKIIQSLLGMTVEPVKFRKAVAVDRATLERYVGKYLLSPFNGFTITLEDGRLMAQLTGQDKYEIFAESETQFFYRAVDAQLEFKPEDNGEVKRLILHQNGGHLPSLKLGGAGAGGTGRKP